MFPPASLSPALGVRLLWSPAGAAGPGRPLTATQHHGHDDSTCSWQHHWRYWQPPRPAPAGPGGLQPMVNLNHHHDDGPTRSQSGNPGTCIGIPMHTSVRIRVPSPLVSGTRCGSSDQVGRGAAQKGLNLCCKIAFVQPRISPGMLLR
eukprot:2703805-Rhodomonas_salina.3